MASSSMSRFVSFGLLIAIILIIGGLFVHLMASFLVPLFLAVLCVVIFRPLHAWIETRCRGHAHLAAGLTTAAILLIVLVPAFSIVTLAAVEGAAIFSTLEVGTIHDRVAKLRSRFDLELPLEDEIQAVDMILRRLAQRTADSTAARAGSVDHPQRSAEQEQLVTATERLAQRAAQSDRFADVNMEALLRDVHALATLAPGSEADGDLLAAALGHLYEVRIALCGGPFRAQLVNWANPGDAEIQRWRGYITDEMQAWMMAAGGATTTFAGQVILGGFVMVMGIYFFLLDGPAIIETLMRLSPLDDRYERELIAQFDGISRAVVLATLLSAVAQGVLAGLGYWMVGLPSVFLFTLLTMLLAFVPFVGAAAIWAPVSLWLYVVDERTWPAILLAVYGAVLVSNIDNVIKPWVLQGRSKLHPLLALLSVMGGIQALGAIGILVGPMIVVFLQTLLNILRQELAAGSSDLGGDAHRVSPGNI